VRPIFIGPFFSTRCSASLKRSKERAISPFVGRPPYQSPHPPLSPFVPPMQTRATIACESWLSCPFCCCVFFYFGKLHPRLLKPFFNVARWLKVCFSSYFIHVFEQLLLPPLLLFRDVPNSLDEESLSSATYGFAPVGANLPDSQMQMGSSRPFTTASTPSVKVALGAKLFPV